MITSPKSPQQKTLSWIKIKKPLNRYAISTLVFTVFFQHYNNLYWYFSTLFIKNEYVAYHMCHLCHIWHIICRICIFLNSSNNRENLRFSGISATKMHLPSYENYLTFMLFGHFAVSHWCHPLAGVLEASLYT